MPEEQCTIKTYIVCSCGKEFVNETEIGYALAIVIHHMKQTFYNLAASLHFIKNRHKCAQKYHEL